MNFMNSILPVFGLLAFVALTAYLAADFWIPILVIIAVVGVLSAAFGR